MYIVHFYAGVHYRMYGHLAATYESAATRQFLLGRTDTIRACSVESLSFCKAVSDPIVTVSNNCDSCYEIKIHL